MLKEQKLIYSAFSDMYTSGTEEDFSEKYNDDNDDEFYNPKELAPRDMIDLESRIWWTGKKSRRKNTKTLTPDQILSRLPILVDYQL